MALSVVDVTQVLAGCHRPDWIARCDPKFIPGTSLLLLTTKECQSQDSRLLDDGMRSFPSKHAGLCFSTWGYISLVVFAALRPSMRGMHSLHTIACAFPLAISFFISMSPVVNFRNHAIDVFAGALIGLAFAAINFKNYCQPIEPSPNNSVIN
ncbi:hypothetical protein DSO57_1016152 [Entomophthora muscae]|uniref:Uncharacterized protein n=1 Tax=Entomophthora muscae TaxID=34485 RepID=A0ACC2T4Y1_9FUNG|nr:hypothetical protein DSO57_1016152 [Entomophthora muscae]